MNKEEQKKFIEAVLSDLKESILKKLDRIPENWDGLELRRYIGDYYDFHYRNVGTMGRTRTRAYNRDKWVIL